MQSKDPQNEIIAPLTPDADVPFLDLSQDREPLVMLSQVVDNPEVTDYVPDSTSVDSLTFHLDKLKLSIAKLEVDLSRRTQMSRFPGTTASGHRTAHRPDLHATIPLSILSRKRPRSSSRSQSPQRPSALKRRRSRRPSSRPPHDAQTQPYELRLKPTASPHRGANSYICQHPELCLGLFCDYPHVVAHASSVGPIPALYGCSHGSGRYDLALHQRYSTGAKLCYAYSSIKPHRSHWTNPRWRWSTSPPRRAPPKTGKCT